MVLTCDDGSIVAEVWQDKDTQKFTCTEYGGYLGFVCLSAREDGGGYLGRRWDGVLTCTADSQRVTEQVSPRADPEGGFTLWMNHGHSSKGFVAQEDFSTPSPIFKVMDPDDSSKTATRFGFTYLQDNTDNNTTVGCYWGFPRPAGTDCPTEGHTYAIQIYGSRSTFTCVDKTQMRLAVYDGSKSQQFVRTLYEGNMGFQCEGGFKLYLGFGSYEHLAPIAWRGDKMMMLE
jgi:hypothetical protein